MSTNENNRTFLGLDFSTQQLKAVLTNFELQVVGVFVVRFDVDLPEFETQDGVHKHRDGLTVTAPPLMWIAALDLLLKRMKQANVEFSKIAAVSGAGQQHGSVYWKHGSLGKLKNLNPEQPLADQLKDCFATNQSPIWMDSSTSVQCQQLEEAVGGPMNLCKITGSRAYHRFTGSQIAKIFQTNHAVYEATERISLVSSFGCTLFLGDYASIDYADGSGMNLFDINNKRLDPVLLQVCGDRLEEKLGRLLPADTKLGPISKYYVERYGFSDSCYIVSFTGDNPASMAGMNLQPNDIAISLGTSDTVIASLQSWSPALNAHVFCSPLDENSFMGLLCFKNGSLSRERIREQCNCKTWDEFNDLLSKTPPGNDGNIGFYYDFPEILPNVSSGYRRFDKQGSRVDSYDPAHEVRAIIEHQCLAKALHLEMLSKMSSGSRENRKVLVTGGASSNSAVLRVISNVFNSKVYVQDVSHSAALGSAFRAKHALSERSVSFADLCRNCVQLTLVAEPDKSAVEIYKPMLERYKRLEAEIIEEDQARKPTN